jgi:hypothetical protein
VRRALVLGSLLAAVTASLATAAGTIRYPIPGASASIAVPVSWKAVDARTATNATAFKRFIDQNPSLRPFVSQISGPGSVSN